MGRIAVSGEQLLEEAIANVYEMVDQQAEEQCQRYWYSVCEEDS